MKNINNSVYVSMEKKEKNRKLFQFSRRSKHIIDYT